MLNNLPTDSKSIFALFRVNFVKTNFSCNKKLARKPIFIAERNELFSILYE